MRVCPADGTRLYEVDNSDPLIGGVIDGRFRVDYILGVGGMGTVYGGVQLSVNRDVAIKVLRAEFATREVALERFFREAQTISRLSHSNIVKLIDFGQDRERGVLYLVMELVRGQNLGDLILKGRLRTAFALDIIYQVCGALTEPHAEGVIHRDLKPDNLLIVPVSDGTLQVKVLDFGIARFMESNTQLTGTGMICGTPAYMAPEQAQNEKLDARTDLYALGVILYEMLAGWPPFSGTSSLQVMLKHIQEVPPMLRELLPPAALPESIEQIVYTLMQKERPLRPSGAHDVRNIIDELRAQFRFKPIRIDPTKRKDMDEVFAPFILPKLPRANDERSGPTQVLMRETGLERGVVPDADSSAPTSVWSSETQADASLGVTGPLSPEQLVDVAGDARDVMVKTREGGQQAWTPADQAVVRSIKRTQDRVDALGVTMASSEGLSADARNTMVEADSSEPLLKVSPGTEEVLEVARRASDIKSTQEHRAVGGTGSLLGFALLGIAAVGAAAFYVNEKLDALQQSPPPPAPLVKAPDPVEPAVVVDTNDIANAVAASFAQSKVWSGVESAMRSATKKGKLVAKRAPPKHVEPPPVADPKPIRKPKNPNDLIEGLDLMKEGD